MKRRPDQMRWLSFRLLVWTCWAAATQAPAQTLRYDNHREVKVPEYATLRLGPFYSDIIFQQSFGYRYSRSKGAGTTFLYNTDRGEYKSDGSEYPIVSAFSFRNYLMVSRRMDLDMSVHVTYSHYPNDTQDDSFDVSMAEEGVVGTLSSSFQLSPSVRGTIYDTILYKTDYLDVRGRQDRAGGQEHRYFSNTIGANGDMLVTPRDNVGLGLSRQDYLVLDRKFEENERVVYTEHTAYERELLKGLVLGTAADFTQTDYAIEERSDTTQQDYSLYTRAGFGEELGEDGVHLKVSRSSVLTLRLGFSVGHATQTGEARTQTENTNVTVFAEGSGSQATFMSGASLRTQLRKEAHHILRYDHGLRSGFTSAFEEYGTLGYDLFWQADLTKINAYSHMDDVTPSGIGDTPYQDWESGVRLTMPLTRVINMDVSTAYDIRKNEAAADAGEGEPLLTPAAEDEMLERTNDYRTWTTRAGTTFAVTRRWQFSTYVQRVQRLSELETLAYTRDTLAAVLTFTHQF